ncbi:MAG: hypothetical protein ABSE58_02735 [Candidatus Limnocylindrales bacterium]|jgi:hypothetical protein
MSIALLLVACVLIGVSAYLVTRVAAFSVVAPVSVQLPHSGPDDPGRIEATSGILGFSPVGELMIPTPGATKGPRLLSTLVDTDRVSVVLATSPNGGWLLTAWPDGSYVKTRCPRPYIFPSARLSEAVLLSGATLPEAYSRHRKAVAEISVQRGEPVRVADPDGVLECFKTANQTAKRLLMRTLFVVMPLGVASWVVLVVAYLIQ